MAMLAEFKKFAMKGNVVDLAVGVIIGGAFGRSSIRSCKDVIMPPIGKLFGGLDFPVTTFRSTASRTACRWRRRRRPAPCWLTGIFSRSCSTS